MTMLDLQRRSKERGWWASFGALPDAHAAYVGLESGAKTVKNFELAVVPGLLQTEDYAQVIVSANRPDDPAEAHRRTALRVRRQEALTTNDDPLELWAIMDEAVLRRATGGPAVMRAQLRHLLDMTKLPNVNILVVPFAEGWHPARSARSWCWSSTPRSTRRSSTSRLRPVSSIWSESRRSGGLCFPSATCKAPRSASARAGR